jgi:hypothetical protein
VRAGGGSLRLYPPGRNRPGYAPPGGDRPGYAPPGGDLAGWTVDLAG